MKDESKALLCLLVLISLIIAIYNIENNNFIIGMIVLFSLGFGWYARGLPSAGEKA